MNEALPRNTILVGNARDQLALVPDASIDCVVTSPPYFGLRNYEVRGQLGLEASVHEWVEDLMAVLAAVARVLKPTGILWLNLGDSYSRHERFAPRRKAWCWPRNACSSPPRRPGGACATRSSGPSPIPCRPASATG